MYSQNDFQEIDQQWKKFLLGIGIYTVIVWIFIIWAVVMRNFYLTLGLTTFWMFVVIFCWGTMGATLFSYRKFLLEIARGLSRTVTGQWVEKKESLVTKEGVKFWEIILQVDDYERVIYFDANKELPDIQKGETVTFTTHGNYVIAIGDAGHE